MNNKSTDVVSGVLTLFGMPTCDNIEDLTADIAFLGIPFDFGSPSKARANTRFGPKVIRGTRSFYSYFDPGTGEVACGWFNADTGVEELKGVTMADCGDVKIVEGSIEQNIDRMTKTVRRILTQGALPLVVGGDHTITFPVVRAFDRYDSLDIVHFDAHMDFTDETDGIRIHNGTPIKRCSELAFVRNITQIGFRSPLTPTYRKTYDAALEYGVKIITAEKFRQMGVNKVIDTIPQSKNIYVSFDIDVLDPSLAPGTSAPQPGGLNYLEARNTLIGIAKRGNVVGFDVVCFSPVYDCSDMTSKIAAELILNFLSSIFSSRKTQK